MLADFIQAVQLFQDEWPEARAHWQQVDPALFAAASPEPVERLMEVMPSAFGALVRAIIHQQVSIYAGRAICGRLVDACGDEVEPLAVLRLSDEDLRAVGLSRQKTIYMRALAGAAAAGDLDDLEEESEAEVTRRLVRLPGIGVWTAKMFCMFHLMRPDVFSGDDLGLREGIRVLDAMPGPLTSTDAERRAEIWSPYRSVAAVALWDLLRRTRAADAEARKAAGPPARSRGGAPSTPA